MQSILKTALMGLVFGTFGTTIGGVIGAYTKNTSKKVLSFIFEFAAGLMISIVCFDLIPEAFEISNFITVSIGIILGVCCMIICDELIRKKYNSKFASKSDSLIKTGLIIGIGLSLHNFPEGLAIGSGFGASFKLGISLSLAIAIHDIPEWISMSVPMKAGGMNSLKVILVTFASGITTGIGALFGVIARRR